MATNPYAAPQTRVSDVPQSHAPAGNFVPEGQAVANGQGWQWIVDGWAIFKTHPGLWIGITVVLALFYIVIGLIPYLGQLATTLLTPVLGAGLLLGCRAIDNGEPLEFAHLFAGFKQQTGKLVALGGISLLAVVAFFVIVFAFGGLGWGLAAIGGGSGAMGFGMMGMLGVLIVLALSVPFYMAMWFAPALVVFHDFDVVPALKSSFSACLKNIVPFLVYGLAFLVLGVLAAIPMGLGLLVLVPVIIASVYTAYRDIFFVR